MFEDYLQRILLLTPPILLALTAHECAHGWVASSLGDPTAKMLDRITLNPIKHLDPVGTLVFFITGMFGWAKPVPVNARYFKDPGSSMMWVSLAGPATNLFLAAVFALVYKLFIAGAPSLGGGASGIYIPLFAMVKISVWLNVALAVFNLLPIPPLDGSKVLMNLLPPQKAMAYSRIEPYGFMILIVLLMTGVIGKVLFPLVTLTVGLLLGGEL
jgi:Zn-dependent protease